MTTTTYYTELAKITNIQHRKRKRDTDIQVAKTLKKILEREIKNIDTCIYRMEQSPNSFFAPEEEVKTQAKRITAIANVLVKDVLLLFGKIK